MTAGKGPYKHPECDRCFHPHEPCPYWMQDSDGHWHHDVSGGQGYVDDVFYGSPDINDDLPTTKDREDKSKRGWW
jgi:hypothetical protein